MPVVAGGKQSRPRMTYRQAQIAAAAAAAKRRQIRRRWIAGGTAVVLVAVVAAVLLLGGSDKKTTVTTTQTSTSNSVDATASAAGKPCVAVSDPLPAGAPAVPVPVGPPPAQLVKQDIKVGTGAEVTSTTATVTVNYIGVSCSTGKIFDSSYMRGQPASLPLNGVIKGWQDGMQGMKVGGQRLLGIPPAQGYGSQGSPPSIAPDETLWFVIDLTDVKTT